MKSTRRSRQTIEKEILSKMQYKAPNGDYGVVDGRHIVKMVGLSRQSGANYFERFEDRGFVEHVGDIFSPNRRLTDKGNQYISENQQEQIV